MVHRTVTCDPTRPDSAASTSPCLPQCARRSTRDRLAGRRQRQHRQQVRQLLPIQRAGQPNTTPVRQNDLDPASAIIAGGQRRWYNDRGRVTSVPSSLNVSGIAAPLVNVLITHTSKLRFDGCKPVDTSRALTSLGNMQLQPANGLAQITSILVAARNQITAIIE